MGWTFLVIVSLLVGQVIVAVILALIGIGAWIVVRNQKTQK